MNRLIKKANKSMCRYKISAIAFTKKGDVIAVSFNGFRFSKYGGGIHAEMKLMKMYGKRIDHIVICRTNGNGKVLPIAPCERCQKIADKLGIKIKSIKVD